MQFISSLLKWRDNIIFTLVKFKNIILTKIKFPHKPEEKRDFAYLIIKKKIRVRVPVMVSLCVGWIFSYPKSQIR
jgi:hypothetical protein